MLLYVYRIICFIHYCRSFLKPLILYTIPAFIELMSSCSEAIHQRRSVRRFSSDPVERTIIIKLIEDAQMAPSAGNLQARDFIVVTNTTVKKKLAEAALNQKFLVQAPVVIAICANIPRSSRIYSGRGELYSIQDAAASTMTLMLSAHELGLATCWVGAFSEAEVSEVLMIPPNVRPVCLLALGHPAETPRAPQRVDVSEVTHWEYWK